MTAIDGAVAGTVDSTPVAAVKPVLVLGLGNDLAGDDGIGVHVARRLIGHPDLPDDVEVRVAGADLLRSHGAMHGRARVVLIDAVLCQDPPGTVLVLDPGAEGTADPGTNAHQLAPTGALALLRATDPALTDLPFTLLGVAIEAVRVEERLSGTMTDRLETVTEGVLRYLSAEASPGSGATPSSKSG